MRRLLVGIAAAVALAGCGVGATDEQVALIGKALQKGVVVPIPKCEEDEPYLRGVGDFDGRRWDRYVCVHVDDVEVTP